MKTEFSYLPLGKQRELEIIADTIKRTIGKSMVVLFGSYARNDYVDRDFTIEDNSIREYRSDYDILVVVKDKKADNNAVGLEYEIEKKLKKLKTPVSVLIEGINHVNQQLDLGRYFYRDIEKEGVCISNNAEFELSKPKRISVLQKQRMASEDYEIWMKKAERWLDTSKWHFKKDWNNDAVFDLHQSAEALFTVINLVYTSYRPKTHDLKKLHEKAVELDERFNIFSLKTQKQKDHFELLRAAYVDARYKKTYEITKEQLKYLERKIKSLIKIVKEICMEKIDSFHKSF